MKSCVLILGLLGSCLCAVAEVVSFPAPIVKTSVGYTVKVNGKPIETLIVPAPTHCLQGDAARSYFAAFFDADCEVTVDVESSMYMADTRILPLSKGVRPTVKSPHAVSFRAKPPFTLAVEPHGRHDALILVANRIDRTPPRRDDPNVVWFGPGSVRDAKPILLKSNQTLYLAPGAYVERPLIAKGTNITVCGHGILSGAPWGHYAGPPGCGGNFVRATGSDIVFRDITLLSGYGWHLTFSKCRNVLVDNIRILGGRVLNDDGIDVLQSRDVTIRNCFIRTQDDCITPKWWCENLLVENCTLWTDVANIFRIGYECEGEKVAYRNFTFRSLDVLHQSIKKYPSSAYWAENFAFIQCGNDERFGDFLFEDIRFDAPEPGDIFFNVKTFKVNDQWQHHKQAGHFDGLVVRNVKVAAPMAANTLISRIASLDADHIVQNVKFENVTGVGPLTLKGVTKGIQVPESSFANPPALDVSAWKTGKPGLWTAKDKELSGDCVYTCVVRVKDPGDNRLVAVGPRLVGEKGQWKLSFLRYAPDDGDRGGRRVFELDESIGSARFVNRKEIRTVYERKSQDAWTFDRDYLVTFRLNEKGLVLSVFDAKVGSEMYAIACQFEGAKEVVRKVRPGFSCHATGAEISKVTWETVK